MRAHYVKGITVTLLTGLLLLLGFPGPVAAIAITEGSFHSGIVFGNGGTFTAPPDFQVMFNLAFNGDLFNSLECSDSLFGTFCGPGAHMTVGRGAINTDVGASVTHGGQTLGRCNVSGLPGEGRGLCVTGGSGRLSWGAELPKFAGATVVSVPATVDVSLFLRVFDSTGPTVVGAGGYSFSGSGTGLMTIKFLDGFEGGEWRFVSAEGRIDPVPEPATLLLFAFTAAGIGLARKGRRLFA